jgi:hypothetical protein
MSNPIGGDRVKQTAEAEHIGPEYTGDNISAKKVANYVWNGTDWERATPAGGAADPWADPKALTVGKFLGLK